MFKKLRSINIGLVTALIFAVLLYILTVKGFVGNMEISQSLANKPPFETSMERGRYAQVVSLAKTGNLNVDEYYKFLKPDIAWYNGHFYSTFPVGTALLAVPFYLFGSLFNLAQITTTFSSTTFALLTFYIIYKTCLYLKLSKQVSLIAGFIYCFASSIFAYSVSLSAHPLSSLTFTISVLLLLIIDDSDNQSSNYKAYLGIGLLFGAQFFIDYPNLAIMFPVVIYSVIKKLVVLQKDSADNYLLDLKFSKGFIALLFGILFFFSIFVIYNKQIYGKVVAFSNSYSLKFLETSGREIENTTLSNELFETRSYAARFDLSGALTGANILLVSSDRGLFYFYPVFLLVIPGFMLFYKKRKAVAVVLLSCVIVNILVYGTYDDPWGGWAFGPRYLSITLTVLAVFCGIAFYQFAKMYGKKFKIIFFAVLLHSAFIALLGALTTNAVPPSVEAPFTGLEDNFVRNWNYLFSTGTSSFVYNLVFIKFLNPVVYATLVFVLIGAFTYSLVFGKSEDMLLDSN